MRTSSRSFSIILVLILIICLSILIGALISLNNYFIMISNIILYVICFFLSFVFRRRFVIEPIFPYLAFHFMIFTLYPFLHIIYGYSFIYGDKVTSYSMILGFFGLFFFCVSYYLTRISANELAIFENKVSITRRQWDRRRVVVTILILTLIGLGAWIWIMETSGGVLEYLSHLHLRVTLLEGKAYASRAVAALVIAAMIWEIDIMQRGKNPLTNLPFAAYAALAVLLQGSLGSRSSLLFSFFMLIFCYVAFKKRIPLILMSSFVVFAIIFLIFGGALRIPGMGLSGAKGALSKAPDAIFQEFVREFDDVERLASVVALVPSTERFYFGKTYLGLLASPIPRGVWPDKPVADEGFIVKALVERRHIYTPAGSTPPTEVGVYYMNFGLIGVICLSFLGGFLCSLSYRIMALNMHRPIFFVFYSISTFLFRGQIVSLNIINTMIWFAICLMASFLLSDEGIFQIRHKVGHPFRGACSQTRLRTNGARRETFVRNARI
jgi:oligosaccharide repeat unit polymerase